MKKIIQSISLILIFLTPVTLSGQTIDLEILAKLESLYPREEGTLKEQKTIELINSIVKELGLKSQKKSINPFNGEAFSYSSNLEIVIPGITKNEVIYLIPIHMPNASLFPALILMEQLSKSLQVLEVGARFVFLGAENGDTTAYPMGTKAFLETYSPPMKSLFFYFNIHTPNQSVMLWNNGDQPAPLSAVKEAKKVFKNTNISLKIPGFSTISSRILPSKNNLIQLYIDEQLSGLELSNYEEKSMHQINQKELEIWAKQIAQGFFDWHKELKKIDETIELSYLTIGQFIFSQTLYLQFLIILFLIFLTKRYRKKTFLACLEILLKYGKFILVVLLISFASLFLSGLVCQSLQIFKGNEVPLKEELALFIFYKIILSYFIFSLFLNHTYMKLSRIPLAKISLIISTILFITFSLINISFGWPFLWFVLILLAQNRVKNTYGQLILAILGSLFIFLNMFSLFRLETLYLIPKLLFGDIFTNMIIAIILLPIAINSLSLHRKNYRITSPKSAKILLQTLCMGILGILIIIYQDFGVKKQPLLIYMQEDLNLDFAVLNFVSPIKIKSLEIYIADEKQSFKNMGKRFTIETQPIDNLNIKYEFKDLIKLKNLNFQIFSELPITEYEILLQSKEEELFVTSMNYPSKNKINTNGTNTIAVLTGKNPPNPLSVQAIINNTRDVIIEVRARANEIPQILEIDAHRFSVEKERYMSKEFTLVDIKKINR
ncbi:MAG: hypothetical protein ACRCVN_06035 [Spirochaetia bacterium]